MPIERLKELISTLESILDYWSTWLEVATLLVVLGLLIEYWYDVRELCKERPFRWKSFVKLFGAVLVTVGVAGELFVQWKASSVDTHLRGANHQVEGILNQQTEDAKREAATANARIKDAEAREREAESQIETAKARAETAKALAEQERTARLELEARLAPREVSKDQNAKLVGQLLSKKALNRKSLRIVSVYNDAESADLAIALYRAFHGAKWNVVGLDEISYVPPTPRGIFVVGSSNDQDHVSSDATAIRDALLAIGIDAVIDVSGEVEKGQMELRIGLKPRANK